MKYEILYTPEAQDHLDRFTARHRASVLRTVEQVLTNHPLSESKNCKKMRYNPLASWRLRIGDLRVYFDVDDNDQCVYVRAAGIKSGNKVVIGGKEQEL